MNNDNGSNGEVTFADMLMTLSQKMIEKIKLIAVCNVWNAFTVK